MAAKSAKTGDMNVTQNIGIGGGRGGEMVPVSGEGETINGEEGLKTGVEGLGIRRETATYGAVISPGNKQWLSIQ